MAITQFTINGETLYSYASLTEANAAIQALQNRRQAWNNLENEEKEDFLASASAAIDSIAFRGIKSNPDQPLAWPRNQVTEGVSTIVQPDNFLPRAVVTATAYLAAEIVADPQSIVPIQYTPHVIKDESGDEKITYSSPTDYVPDTRTIRHEGILTLLQPFAIESLIHNHIPEHVQTGPTELIASGGGGSSVRIGSKNEEYVY